MNSSSVKVEDAYNTAVISYLLANPSSDLDSIIEALEKSFKKKRQVHATTIKLLKLSVDIFLGQNIISYNSNHRILLTKDIFKYFNENPSIVEFRAKRKKYGEELNNKYPMFKYQTVDNSMDMMAKVFRVYLNSDNNSGTVGIGNGTTGSHKGAFHPTKAKSVVLNIAPLIDFLDSVKNGDVTRNQFEIFISEHSDSLKLLLDTADRFNLYKSAFDSLR